MADRLSVCSAKLSAHRSWYRYVRSRELYSGLTIVWNCLHTAGEFSFECGNCALERLAEYPALPVGDSVERLDYISTRLDVELDVAPGTVAPRFPFRRARQDLTRWLTALKISGFGDCPHLLGPHLRRYGLLRGKAADVKF